MKYTKSLPDEEGWYFITYESEEKCGLRGMTVEVLWFHEEDDLLYPRDEDDECEPIPVKTILREAGIDMNGKTIFYAGPIGEPEENEEIENIYIRQEAHNQKVHLAAETRPDETHA